MAVPPFLPLRHSYDVVPVRLFPRFRRRLPLVALQPEKLTDGLGKFLCPMPLLLVGAMFVGRLVHPVGTYGPALPPYDQDPGGPGLPDRLSDHG